MRGQPGLVASAVAACTMAAVIMTAAGGLAQEQTPTQPVFRSATSGVSVDVSVRNRSRRTITGLDASDFQVFDNGVEQAIDSVSYGKLPIDVTVALDVSYSVTGSLLDRLRRAIAALMKDLGPSDRLKLVLFNMKVSRAVDFTTDIAEVDRAIAGATAGGGTALLDTINVSLIAAPTPDRRHLVVFFTDGRDSTSVTTPARLREVAERTRASLAFVLPDPARRLTTASGAVFVLPDTREAGPLNAFALMGALAAQTGGSVLPVLPDGDLTATFRRVLEEFRSAYVLYYDARGVDRTGYHTIEVRVNRRDAVVQARRGYWY